MTEDEATTSKPHPLYASVPVRLRVFALAVILLVLSATGL